MRRLQRAALCPGKTCFNLLHETVAVHNGQLACSFPTKLQHASLSYGSTGPECNNATVQHECRMLTGRHLCDLFDFVLSPVRRMRSRRVTQCSDIILPGSDCVPVDSVHSRDATEPHTRAHLKLLVGAHSPLLLAVGYHFHFKYIGTATNKQSETLPVPGTLFLTAPNLLAKERFFNFPLDILGRVFVCW